MTHVVFLEIIKAILYFATKLFEKSHIQNDDGFGNIIVLRFLNDKIIISFRMFKIMIALA